LDNRLQYRRGLFSGEDELDADTLLSHAGGEMYRVRRQRFATDQHRARLL